MKGIFKKYLILDKQWKILPCNPNLLVGFKMYRDCQKKVNRNLKKLITIFGESKTFTEISWFVFHVMCQIYILGV